jgi:hypothetical protein
MTRPRSKYQVQFCEAIDESPDDWRDYGGMVSSEAAARSRAQELMLIRPTRRYRIQQIKIHITRHSIWQSDQKAEKA